MPDALLRGLAASASFRGIREGRAYCVSQSNGVIVRDQPAMPSIGKDLAVPVNVRGDDRACCRHRFQKNVGCSLKSRRMNIQIKGAQPLWNVSAVSCKVSPLTDPEAASEDVQALQFLASSSQEQMHGFQTRTGQGLQENVKPLLMREAPNAADEYGVGPQTQFGS